MIRDFKEGAKVVITERTFLTIKNSNRSLKYFPSDSFVKNAKKLIGIEGTVIKRFENGFGMNVEFRVGKKIFLLEMKDNWVEPLDENWEEVCI